MIYFMVHLLSSIFIIEKKRKEKKYSYIFVLLVLLKIVACLLPVYRLGINKINYYY